VTNRFVQQGFAAPDAAQRALAQLDANVQRQAAALGFLDCFWLLGIVAFAAAVLTIFIRRFSQGGTGTAH
jgi:hypothetical protein